MSAAYDLGSNLRVPEDILMMSGWNAQPKTNAG